MSENFDNEVTAALRFNAPQKVGWSVQRRDQSWSGNELAGLADCLAKKGRCQAITLSLSLIFELPENNGTLWR